MKKTFILLLLVVLSLTVFRKAILAQEKQKGTFNHIALSITDLEKSTVFYRDVLQLKIIPNPFNDGKHTWFQLGETSQMHLIAGAKPGMQHYKNVHTCFSVNSVADFAALLAKKNIVYENLLGEAKAVTLRADGVKQIYFQDPDGYWLEVNDAK